VLHTETRREAFKQQKEHNFLFELNMQLACAEFMHRLHNLLKEKFLGGGKLRLRRSLDDFCLKLTELGDNPGFLFPLAHCEKKT
jgi:hypothetical protein